MKGLRRLPRLLRLLITVTLVFVAVSLYTNVQDSRIVLPGVRQSELSSLNAQLTGLPNYRVRIVKLVESQIGYKTSPLSSYCNKFSAYWVSGASDCGAGLLDEEWCADFAAWAWQLGGAQVTYQYINGDLNSSSASFYEWGVAHHTWHPVGSGYVPLPGDVAVYGLDPGALVAAHVAVVVGVSGPNHLPDAVNGDGDHLSFSDVEFVMNEVHPDVSRPSLTLSGYVSPSPR